MPEESGGWVSEGWGWKEAPSAHGKRDVEPLRYPPSGSKIPNWVAASAAFIPSSANSDVFEMGWRGKGDRDTVRKRRRRWSYIEKKSPR